MTTKFTHDMRERDGIKLVYTTESITWPDLQEEFNQFLRGCGFFIPEDGDDESVEDYTLLRNQLDEILTENKDLHAEIARLGGVYVDALNENGRLLDEINALRDKLDVQILKNSHTTNLTNSNATLVKEVERLSKYIDSMEGERKFGSIVDAILGED